MNIYLLVIIVLSFFLNYLIYYQVKNTTFFGKKNSCDSEKNIKAGINSRIFDSLSSVNFLENARSQCRELHFFFSKLFNKIFFNNVIEDKVHIFLHLTCNFIFSIFFFLFFREIFNDEISFFLSLIFVFSMWPYQVCIYWGHIILSSMWFMISIYLTTFLNANLDIINIYFITSFISLFCCLSYFSSSSSRKYPLVIFIFFLIGLYRANILEFDFSINKLIVFVFIVILIHSSFNWIFDLILNFTLKLLNYDFKISFYKNKIIFKKILYLFFLIFEIFGFVIFFSFFSIHLYFLLFLFSLIFIFFSCLVFYPKFLLNIYTHFSFLDIGVWANHFNAYPKNFFSKYTIDKNFRGGEWYLWLPRFFFRISTIPFVMYLFSIFVLSFSLQFDLNLIFLVTSLIPLLIAEFSKMIRVSKAYYPVYFGFFLGVGSALNYINNNFNQHTYFLYAGLSIILIMHILIDFRKLFFDVIPSRMYQYNLYNYLTKKGVRKFSTFNSTFNDSAIIPMLDKYSNFKVEFVKKISDSTNSYFVCPPLSSKSVLVETDKSAIKKGDLTNDKQIQRLMKNKILDKKSLITFKTFASSKIYVLESEVTSFRDLCLNDIKNYDRWLGLSRVFKLRKGKVI